MQGYAVKKIAEYASNRGFTNLIVLNENRKEVNGLLLVHLPNGPTAQFRLANLKLAREIKVCDQLPRACLPLPRNPARMPSAFHPWLPPELPDDRAPQAPFWAVRSPGACASHAPQAGGHPEQL